MKIINLDYANLVADRDANGILALINELYDSSTSQQNFQVNVSAVLNLTKEQYFFEYILSAAALATNTKVVEYIDENTLKLKIYFDRDSTNGFFTDRRCKGHTGTITALLIRDNDVQFSFESEDLKNLEKRIGCLERQRLKLTKNHSEALLLHYLYKDEIIKKTRFGNSTNPFPTTSWFLAMVKHLALMDLAYTKSVHMDSYDSVSGIVCRITNRGYDVMQEAGIEVERSNRFFTVIAFPYVELWNGR
ncbi:hypothetical protein [Pseudomonas lactis]|uniref:hypothetical protein n=1 Tax=Pseudomonas lactis TaxID=1615674 RepID=UPI003F7D8270